MILALSMNIRSKTKLLCFANGDPPNTCPVFINLAGKLFKCDVLPQVVEFLLLFYEHKPVDWLLDNFFHVRECMGVSCLDAHGPQVAECVHPDPAWHGWLG